MTTKVHHFRHRSAEEVTKIKSKYPLAIPLLEYLEHFQLIPFGLEIVNHPDIPPLCVTREMLEGGFPSYHDTLSWYVPHPMHTTSNTTGSSEA